MQNWVFRHEPSPEPTRMQAFRVREFVRVGTPDVVVAWRDMWLERGLELLKSLGLPAKSDVASDPFFGRGGRMLAATQQRAEAQVRGARARSSPRRSRRPCARSTTTRTTSARSSSIKTPDGDDRAHRVPRLRPRARVMALFKTHGFDPGSGRRPCARSSGRDDRARRASAPIDPQHLRAARAAPRRARLGRVELLHRRLDRGAPRPRLEPLACLPFVLAVDFEGDQWTFFKPPHDDLVSPLRRRRAGAQRLAPLLENASSSSRRQARAQPRPTRSTCPTRRDRLPAQHTKTTIGIQDSTSRRRARLLPQRGLLRARGRRLRGLFRLDAPPTRRSCRSSPSSCARVASHAARGAELVAPLARALAKHLARRPRDEPVRAVRRAFAADRRDLMRARACGAYHAWAFATMRQLGAGVRARRCLPALARGARRSRCSMRPRPRSTRCPTTSKSLILKTARAVCAKKPVDLAPMLADIEGQWEAGMRQLAARFDVGVWATDQAY